MTSLYTASQGLAKDRLFRHRVLMQRLPKKPPRAEAPESAMYQASVPVSCDSGSYGTLTNPVRRLDRRCDPSYTVSKASGNPIKGDSDAPAGISCSNLQPAG